MQVKYKGYDKLAFSTNISLYFENGTKYGHSYNGRRIGTPIYRMVPFPMSFNNLLPTFQGHHILNAK